MASVHRLIKSAREAKGWSMQHLASEVSKAEALATPLTWQTVQQWEKEGGTAPRRKRMETVAKLLGLDVVSMLGGESAATPIDLENNHEYPAIRRVTFKLSAGASGFGIQYRDERGAPIVFQRQWYESRNLRPEKLFAVEVSNGSMEPGLYDGDTVVVNTDAVEPKDGVVFAVNYEGELVIKRLIRDEGRWWLSSDNPDQRKYPRKACDEHSVLIGEIVHKQSEKI